MTSLPHNAALRAPAPADIARIAAVDDPVLRNLQITQCYYELSAAFVTRTGSGANWCTFATWASRQAGQTIRREDMVDSLFRLLKSEPGVQEAITALMHIARRLGAATGGEQVHQSVIQAMVRNAADKASAAVSAGNLKVFVEIAPAFARFLELCSADTANTASSLTSFCSGLRPGPPPQGQDYLQRAFTNYYQAFFTTHPQDAAELCLLANLEVGLHEQTRLQPEIAASMLPVAADVPAVKAKVLEVLFPPGAYGSRFRLMMYQLLRKTGVLDQAIHLLLQRVQQALRRVMTIHLMTLTIPPGLCLQLGHDLRRSFPDALKAVSHPGLLQLLQQIDPTPNSLEQSGAADWANLGERMHYIADLFRCCHRSTELLQPPFNAEQVQCILSGRLPPGNL